MRIYTKDQWAEMNFKGVWSDSPAFKAMTGIEKIPAGLIGRRYILVSGPDGGEYQTEGIHFLVEDDYTHLPILKKSNVMVGACYRFTGGYIQVTEIIRYTEEEARELDLYYLDHVRYVYTAKWGTTSGGCAIPGGDTRIK